MTALYNLTLLTTISSIALFMTCPPLGTVAVLGSLLTLAFTVATEALTK